MLAASEEATSAVWCHRTQLPLVLSLLLPLRYRSTVHSTQVPEVGISVHFFSLPSLSNSKEGRCRFKGRKHARAPACS